MMRKDASFFMEYACTKKNKVPQEFHFIYFLEINFAFIILFVLHYFQDFSSPNSI